MMLVSVVQIKGQQALLLKMMFMCAVQKSPSGADVSYLKPPPSPLLHPTPHPPLTDTITYRSLTGVTFTLGPCPLWSRRWQGLHEVLPFPGLLGRWHFLIRACIESGPLSPCITTNAHKSCALSSTHPAQLKFKLNWGFQDLLFLVRGSWTHSNTFEISH